MKKLLLIATVIGLVSCTDNQKAKNWGGTVSIPISNNKKLVNATWKETNLWILTRDKRDGEVAESYHFAEDSEYGIVEGEIIFNENFTQTEPVKPNPLTNFIITEKGDTIKIKHFNQ